MGFVEGTHWVVFQKDGRVVVADAAEKKVLAEVPLPTGTKGFWVVQVEAGHTACVFLLDKEVRVQRIEGGHKPTVVALEERPTAFAFDKSEQSLWILGHKKLRKFDVKTEKIVQHKDNKHNFGHLAAAGGRLLLWSQRAFQLSLTDSHLATTLQTVSDSITCGAVAVDNMTGSTFVALGSLSGNLTLHKFGTSAELLVRSSKKWHSNSVATLLFDGEGKVLYSAGEEDVVMLWDHANHKTDFIPRFTDRVTAMALSEAGVYFAVLLRNGWVSVRHSQTFEVVFEFYGLSLDAFSESLPLTFGSSLAKINKQLRLGVYKVSQDEGSGELGFSGRQFNPTGRHVVSTTNEDSSTQYTVTAINFSPDESLLVSAEALVVRETLVSSRLRFHLVRDSAQKLREMAVIENPHLGEPVASIHFHVDPKTGGDLNRKPGGDSRHQVLQDLGARGDLQRRIRGLNRCGKKRPNSLFQPKALKRAGFWTPMTRRTWPFGRATPWRWSSGRPASPDSSCWLRSSCLRPSTMSSLRAPTWSSASKVNSKCSVWTPWS